MKKKYFVITLIVSFIVSSCELISPSETVNPNVNEDSYLHSSNPMTTWVNGTKRTFAQGIGRFCLYTEIISDNYFNNYTRENKVFDIPKLDYTDPDIETMLRIVASMRESADYGLTIVRRYDAQTTDRDLFQLLLIKAYSYILAGENFVALPLEEAGEIVNGKEQLMHAIPLLDSALAKVSGKEDAALINTLKARVYYQLGDKLKAVEAAELSLTLSSDFVYQVTFDGVNGVGNAIQDVVWKTMFQPLPRLDFLDPKYFQLMANEERPICIGKAEENYLILAEAAIAMGQIGKAHLELQKLLDLVASRPKQTQINDQLEGRYNGGFKKYPNASVYRVAASATDPYRAGLVLDRTSPHLIAIPYISGTSVTPFMLQNSIDIDAMLEIVYLLRQEIFFAEGRRMTDLGIRLPLSEVEAKQSLSGSTYTKAYIPSFIPLGQEMDAFEIDEANKIVTIKYNMNKILVKNRYTDDVLPFF